MRYSVGPAGTVPAYLDRCGVPTVTASTVPTDPAAPPALLSVGDVAALLCCSSRHVLRLADAGRMPPGVRLGALRRWRRADLDAWLAGGCRPVRPTRER